MNIKEKIQKLKNQLIDLKEKSAAAEKMTFLADQYKNRSVFFAAPLSFYGLKSGKKIAETLGESLIACIDDRSSSMSLIHGAPRWSTDNFLENIRKYKDPIIFDFSSSPNGRNFVAKLAAANQTETIRIAPEDTGLIPDYENRPVFFLSSDSSVGKLHFANIVANRANIIAAIDDSKDGKNIEGIEYWSTAKWLANLSKYPTALAVDCSDSIGERAKNRKQCALAGLEIIDFTLLIAHWGMHAVYEPARVYRELTLQKFDDFLSLADRFEDDLSVLTLYSNLLFRITYDPSYLQNVWSSPDSEYFSLHCEPNTFTLGKNEHFCDCGAYHGTIVKKFLEATRYEYQSITAFEPDVSNHEVLSKISSPVVKNFRAINKAISNKQEELRFNATGSVASALALEGNVRVQATCLDDELEKVTFIKMDIEGSEIKALEGASRLIQTQRPRMVICVYHYALDLLGVLAQLDRLVDGYHYRLRQHGSSYYWDLVLYASPVPGAEPPEWAA